MASLDDLAPHFERLRVLAENERAIALRELPLDAAACSRLTRMLAADAAHNANGDDALARLIATSAAGGLIAPAQQLGPYRLLHELGAGGMGTVYLAERVDGQFTRQVAIKLLRGFPTREASRRLRLERQILAELDHPNIARLLDGGEIADGQPWLAIEYVDGVALLDFVAQRAPELRDRLALFDAMLEAVAHAHRHLIVHRDLKPANVLVTHGGIVKLLDFGIARLLEVGEDSAQRETSTRVYSRGYASPEQQDGRAITTASDIYSLGVMLREMLSGRPDAEANAVFDPLPLDADLVGILVKSTATDPLQRYASATEFADDVRRYREGRPVRAASWTRNYRLRKFIGRHRFAFAAALIAAAVIAGFVWRIGHERNRALAAEAVTQRALQAAERDAASARASLDFLANAFAAAAPGQALSRQVSVRSLLDSARAQIAHNPNPTVVKTVQRLLAHLYAELGEASIALDLMRAGTANVVPTDRAEGLRLADDYDQYSELLGIAGDGVAGLAIVRTANQWRELFAPGDRIEKVRSLQSLAQAYYRSDNDPEAIKLLRQAIALADETPTLPFEMYADIAQTLSVLLATNGQAEAALALADQGLRRIADRLPTYSLERMKLLHAKAVALSAVGDPAAAEKLLREAITLQDRVVASGGSRMMVLNNDLALILNDLGRYREAAEMLRKSDRNMNHAGISGAADRALSHANYAGVLENAGDYANAIAEFDDAMHILDAGNIDADRQVRRRITRSQARTLGIAGQHQRALAMLTDLRQRCARIEGDDSSEYAMLTWQLALLAKRMQQPETGKLLLEQALRLWRGLVPDTHSIFLQAKRLRAAFALAQGDVAAAARDLESAVAGFQSNGALPVDLAIARSELAQVRWRQRRHNDARKLLQQALPDLRSALLPGEISRAAAEQLTRRLAGTI